MKKRLMALVATFACVLCLALVGCGGGGASKKDFVGTWELSGGISDGAELSAEDVEFVNSMGAMQIILNEDGTAALSMFGQEEPGTWEYKGNNTASMEIDGQSGDLKLDGDKLIMETDESNKMEFTKKS